MLKPRFFVLMSFILGISCNENIYYTQYSQLNNGIWKETDTLEFSIKDLDTLPNYDLFFNVRNDQSYAYSNLFVITEFQHPKGKIEIDTLEYLMAEPNGKWLGKGMGSIKESKLWYKENIKLQDSGVYRIRITQAMRKNGEVDGLSALEGITDFGVEIRLAQ